MRERRLFGQSVPTDEAFDAWTSGDLDRMVAALPLARNNVDRHFLLSGIAEKASRDHSRDARMATLCEEYARQHIAEFPLLLADLERNRSGPRYQPSYGPLADVLHAQNRLDEELAVCEEAWRVTRAPMFQARSARLRKKLGA